MLSNGSLMLYLTPDPYHLYVGCESKWGSNEQAIINEDKDATVSQLH